VRAADDPIISASLLNAENTMSDSKNHNSIDALLPPEMAERAEQIGVEKTRLDTLSLMALAVLAGAFVGFGSMFSVVVTTGAEGVLPFGVTRLLGAWSFRLASSSSSSAEQSFLPAII